MSPNETKIETYSTLQWIDNHFLKNSLEHFYADKKINVICYDVMPATKKGENYASCIYRVNVTFGECHIENDNHKVSTFFFHFSTFLFLMCQNLKCFWQSLMWFDITRLMANLQ